MPKPPRSCAFPRRPFAAIGTSPVSGSIEPSVKTLLPNNAFRVIDQIVRACYCCGEGWEGAAWAGAGLGAVGAGLLGAAGAALVDGMTGAGAAGAGAVGAGAAGA